MARLDGDLESLELGPSLKVRCRLAVALVHVYAKSEIKARAVKAVWCGS